MHPTVASTDRILHKLSSSQFHSEDEVTVLSLSWNVNGKLETLENMTRMVACNIPLETKVDIVVVNLQEVIELSAQSVVSHEINISGSNTIDKCKRWQETILEALNHKFEHYREVSSLNLMGLWIGIFALNVLAPHIYDIQAVSVSRNLLGTKGATMIHIKIHDTAFCFVNAHLSAHRDHVSKRNQDYHHIVSARVFHDGDVLSKSQMIALNQKLVETAKDIQLTGFNKEKLRFDLDQLRFKLNSNRRKINSLARDIATSFDSSSGSNSNRKPETKRDPMINLEETNLIDEDTEVEAEVGIGLEVEVEVEVDRSVSHQSDGSEDVHHQHHLHQLQQTNQVNSVRMKVKSIAEDAAIFNFSVEDHDIIIFSGDLNYRIAEDLDINAVYEHIDQPERYHQLLNFDQLNIERQHGRIFHGYSEGEIGFLPTYQFICGTNLYDRRPEKKMRCPAWCDRILYRQGRYTRDHEASAAAQAYQSGIEKGLDLNHSFETIRLLAYESLPEFVISDHTPVRACFSVTIKRMDYAMRELSMLEAIESEFNCMEARLAMSTADDSTTDVHINKASNLFATTDSYEGDNSAELHLDEVLSNNPYIQSMHRYPSLDIVPKYVTLLPASVNQKSAKISLCNYEKVEIFYRVESFSIPFWLHVDNKEGKVRAGSRHLLTIQLQDQESTSSMQIQRKSLVPSFSASQSLTSAEASSPYRQGTQQEQLVALLQISMFSISRVYDESDDLALPSESVVLPVLCLG